MESSYYKGQALMNITEAIYARRSIRKFLPQPVPRETLNELVRLACAAPSAVNRKPWAFIVVDEPQALARLQSALLLGKYNAPAAIVVCADRKRALPAIPHEYWVQDCAAAMQNILLGALHFDLGTVWIGGYPVGATVALMRRALHLPEHIVPLGTAYIGYPAQQPPPRTQFEPGVLRYQRWQAEPPKARKRLFARRADEQSAGDPPSGQADE